MDLGALEPRASQSPALSFSAWRPKYGSEDRTAHVAYQSGSHEVTITLQQYISQEQSGEAVAAGNPLGRPGWRVMGRSRKDLSINESLISVNRAVIEGPAAQRQVVLFWYRVGGKHLANPYMVKILEAWSHLRRESPLSTRIYIAYPEDEGISELNVAQLFIDEALQDVELALDRLN